eukprot:CAMPEP_0197735350 /NCGR_PEP_ID=MMETSP1435-20131217/601_1 /TAXON_ID=426625 /ORGANISM="Chaetoceros brevis, Strain CCMP164" /LENGTH=113 /DNA_ID=CAMNT_0043323041 /DNA_START=36 /DNA_END=377 /DNA_ORIENTATION=-
MIHTSNRAFFVQVLLSVLICVIHHPLPLEARRLGEVTWDKDCQEALDRVKILIDKTDGYKDGFVAYEDLSATHDILLQKWFKALDSDNDGRLSGTEIKEAFVPDRCEEGTDQE